MWPAERAAPSGAWCGLQVHSDVSARRQKIALVVIANITTAGKPGAVPTLLLRELARQVQCQHYQIIAC